MADNKRGRRVGARFLSLSGPELANWPGETDDFRTILLKTEERQTTMGEALVSNASDASSDASGGPCPNVPDSQTSHGEDLGRQTDVSADRATLLGRDSWYQDQRSERAPLPGKPCLGLDTAPLRAKCPSQWQGLFVEVEGLDPG